MVSWGKPAEVMQLHERGGKKSERKESPQTELHFSSSRQGLEEASQAAEDSTAEHNYSRRALVKESVNG